VTLNRNEPLSLLLALPSAPNKIWSMTIRVVRAYSLVNKVHGDGERRRRAANGAAVVEQQEHEVGSGCFVPFSFGGVTVTGLTELTKLPKI
jgi:hypothetical protein